MSKEDKIYVKGIDIRFFGKTAANEPFVGLVLSRLPKPSDFRYEYIGNGLYLGEYKGLYRFYHWSGKGNDGGFYGGHVDIVMKNGEKVKLLGPWSSRAGVINKHITNDSRHIIEVGVTDDIKSLNRHFTYSLYAIRVKTLRRIINTCCSFLEVAKEVSDTDIHYYVRFKGDKNRDIEDWYVNEVSYFYTSKVRKVFR